MTPETPDGERIESGGWLTRFVRARRNEIVSLLLCGGGLYVLVAVLTFNPLDPSLNADTGRDPTNALGAYGAIAADLTLQWLGWAGAALAVMLVAWGAILFWRGPRQRGVKIVLLRIIAALMAVGGFAAAASSLPVPATWPFAAGLGGAIGDIVHLEVAGILSAVALPFATGVAGVITLIIGMLGLVGGYGITPGDIADAAETGRRMARRTSYAARRIADRYVQGMDEEIVRLEPVETRARITTYDNYAELERVRPRMPDASYARRPQPAPAPAQAEAAVHQAPPPAQHAPAPAQEEPAPNLASAFASVPPNADPRRPAPPRQGRLFDGEDGEIDLPDPGMLSAAPERAHVNNDGELDERAEELENVLLDFNIKGQVVNARPGPVVTLFEFEPAPGVRSSRVINLADDIARSVSAQSARVAVVPGRNVIGIELPNVGRETVFLRDLLESEPYNDRKMQLPLALGETIGGEPYVADLAKMPHLLIAGTTGSGKSVGINAMILSLMHRLTPDRCRFIMIDPKMLELSVYDDIPHLLTPVVTDPKKAVVALKWTVREMEARYRRMAKMGVRNIAGYNRRIEEASRNGRPIERTVQTGYDQETGKPLFDEERVDAAPMPYIVVVIDEMADLMLVAGREIEATVQRLAQMARAAGIHLIMATQRPSVDVITGTIRANFPTRMSYAVTSRVDSRIIIGEQGAEQLLGQGDLLLMAAGGRIRRLHGPFVADEEVNGVASFLRSQGAPEYIDDVTRDVEEPDGDGGGTFPGADGGTGDELYDRAIEIVTRDRRASTSYLQRKLSIGYNRAATLMERLEQDGVVSAANNAGKREILAPPPPPEPDGPGMGI